MEEIAPEEIVVPLQNLAGWLYNPPRCDDMRKLLEGGLEALAELQSDEPEMLQLWTCYVCVLARAGGNEKAVTVAENAVSWFTAAFGRNALITLFAMKAFGCVPRLPQSL